MLLFKIPLFCVVPEGELEVQLESYARIKHLFSNTWLHLDGILAF